MKPARDLETATEGEWVLLILDYGRRRVPVEIKRTTATQIIFEKHGERKYRRTDGYMVGVGVVGWSGEGNITATDEPGLAAAFEAETRRGLIMRVNGFRRGSEMTTAALVKVCKLIDDGVVAAAELDSKKPADPSA